MTPSPCGNGRGVGVGGLERVRVGQGPPEDGKQAWRTAEAFGSAGPTLGEPTLPSSTHQHHQHQHQPGLFLKCGGGKALKALSFMLKASKRRDGQAAAAATVRSGLELKAKHQ